MGGSSSVIPRHEKSNVELINSLRYNIIAAQRLRNPQAQATGTNPDVTNNLNISNDDYTTWTEQQGDTLYVPAIDFPNGQLSEEIGQYDITVKLFYLPGVPASQRCEHTRDAINLVLKQLGVDSIDLLIVSFPGVSFDADADDEAEEVTNEGVESELDSMVTTWRTVEALHDKGMIAQLGLAEFDTERLVKFLPHTKVRPSVNQINLRDCCVVPKDLILFAKQERIELLTHNDCTNILPQGTTRDLLSRRGSGAGILAASANADDGGIKGDIDPQWVVKYTAVVKDRGVVENKGYFALADVGCCIRPQQ